MQSKIIKAAHAFPTNCYSNQEFIKKYKIDTTSDWIESMTGINQRYFINSAKEFEEIVIKAAQTVLQNFNGKIDAIVVATSTNPYYFPGLSQIVHKALGCGKNVRTIDTNAACNGFMQALAIADSFIRYENMENVLVIGADAMSTVLDMNDRSTCCLFGDGAGAVILSNSNSAQEGSKAIKAWEHVTLSENYESLIAEKFVVMNGRSVFENSIKTFEEIITKVIEKGGLKIEEVDLFILHQANYRIFNTLAKKMNLDEAKIPFLAKDFANTSAATIPICLSLTDFKNKNIVLAGFGAGFVASATLLS